MEAAQPPERRRSRLRGGAAALQKERIIHRREDIIAGVNHIELQKIKIKNSIGNKMTSLSAVSDR